jgi:erythronate-4-phosphate dehydrogenase
MKIIADENIPCVRQAFATLGEVTLLPGRSLQASDVRNADVLLVRSVTPVGPALLDGSRVRFVGSATIGFDHVDREYLERRGIGFATAPGSNATSAAEYVLSALLALAEREGFSLTERTVGIVGCGNVGSRVRQKLTALGMHCLVNDPPLQARTGNDGFVTLDDIMMTDIITVHVPLTVVGHYPTRHLFDAARIKRLRPHTILINTARGAVVDNPALAGVLRERADLSAVLDVWEGEPAISMELLARTALGTPHIAGYSLDGKLRGTEMIYRAACRHLGQPQQWSAASELPAGRTLTLQATSAANELQGVGEAVLRTYDVRTDDARLRELIALAPQARSRGFDDLRKHYPVRREFSCTTVGTAGRNDGLQQLLHGVGFRVAPVASRTTTRDT